MLTAAVDIVQLTIAMVTPQTVPGTGAGWQGGDDSGAVSQVVGVLSVHILHAQPGARLGQLVRSASRGTQVTLATQIQSLVLVVSSPDQLSDICEPNGGGGHRGGHTGHLIVRRGGGGAGRRVRGCARILHAAHRRQARVGGEQSELVMDIVSCLLELTMVRLHHPVTRWHQVMELSRG